MVMKAVSYNISSLIVDVLFDALWSHPPNGDLLFTPSFTLITTKVIPGIHILGHSKVSYLDNTVLVNPTTEFTLVALDIILFVMLHSL